MKRRIGRRRGISESIGGKRERRGKERGGALDIGSIGVKGRDGGSTEEREGLGREGWLRGEGGNLLYCW